MEPSSFIEEKHNSYFSILAGKFDLHIQILESLSLLKVS